VAPVVARTPTVVAGSRRTAVGVPLLEQWVSTCLLASHHINGHRPAPTAMFFSGARKIIHPYTIVFTSIDDSIQLRHAGFTSAKLKALTRHYLVLESLHSATTLWKKRREQEKYGSVVISCFGHFVKGDVKGATPRGSIFGPCINSVVITWLAKDLYKINVFYRTTELYKKFAPDLVFIRDILLAPFDFSDMHLRDATFYFANATLHPMYWGTIVPHIDDPIAELEMIRETDPFFHKWIVKWTARYLVPKYHHGIAKFAQALRVQKDLRERIDSKIQTKLRHYLTDNHPGYRKTRFENADDTD
jgi:hypothetical protein